MRNTVDLNSDLGESFGSYKIGMDEQILKYVSSANIGCGWHAGDPMVMERTISMGIKNKLGIGAHPGFPDLLGFGRRKMDVTPEEGKNYVIYQLGALQAFARAKGIEVQHIKLHGAFYNMAAVDYKLSLEIAKGIYEVDKNIILLALAGSQMVKAGKEVGLKVAEEVFADRAYNSDGTLVSRKLPGSVIHDKNLAIERVKSMVKYGKVKSITGEEITIQADSICVHGDNQEALAFVKLIREELEKDNIKIKPLRELIK